MRVMVLLALVLAACGDNGAAPTDTVPAPPPVDAEPVPALRNPVDLPDDELAPLALQLLGARVDGARESCDTCHGVTRQHLAYWRSLSDAALGECIVDPDVSSPASARRMIDCLRSDPAQESSGFVTEKLGIYAIAVGLPWFDYVVRRAYGDDAPQVLQALRAQTSMPRGTAPAFTQAEFDIVAEWYARGLPQLDQRVIESDPPSECLPGISAAVPAHVAAMRLAGWRAINRSNLMPMYDLTGKPLAAAQPYGAGWDVGAARIRVLADVTYSSAYWTRSSPDGRFVGHGNHSTGAATLLDLARDAQIRVVALYDPAFFPDGSGFMFQDGPAGNTCASSVLAGAPDEIRMSETGCAKLSSVGLYQHVGRAAGGDYLAIAGSFVSDDGGHRATLRDPRAFFGETSKLGLTRMFLDGGVYQARPKLDVATPFEGDAVLAPSSKLVITRYAGPGGRQLGYVLRALSIDGESATAPEIARYCLSGGKPAFSYDERWAAFHHYVTDSDADARELGFRDATDPGFAPYRTRGAANLFLLDLATGARTRITNVGPGQYALYPHFRSDGWIYAQVRDLNASHEYTIASDAALLAE